MRCRICGDHRQYGCHCHICHAAYRAYLAYKPTLLDRVKALIWRHA